MDGHPEIDLAHIHWSSPEIIYSLPNKSLSTPDEALDYFAFSPFFDVRSNNQVLRVQRLVTGIPYGHAQEKLDLLNFRSGFEFVIAHSSPPDLFVVHKRNVGLDGNKTNVLGAWFILEGKIYPCPTVYDVIATRLKNASFLVSSTFATLSALHPPSNPRTHSTWRSLPPTDEKANSKKPQEEPSAEMTETSNDAEDDSKAESSAPNFALFNALQSSRNAIADLENLSQGPAPSSDPADELRRIEEEIMGASADGIGQVQGIGQTGTSNPARSTRSASVAPTMKDREKSIAGTPGARLLSGRTPAVVASSPLAYQG